MKSSFEPMIYTRIHKVDYKVLAAPASLQTNPDWEKLLRHAQYVMSDDGSRGPLKERRWHIMTINGHILVGIATYEFRCEDNVNRPIRGYYGMLMECDAAFIPVAEAFHQLYLRYVKPIFYKPPIQSNYWMPPINDMDVQTWIDSNAELDSTFPTIQFNHEQAMVKFFPPEKHIETMLHSALLEAMTCASSGKEFEFVWELTSKSHALEVPFMNVVCSEVKRETIIQIDVQTPYSPSVQASTESISSDDDILNGKTADDQENSKRHIVQNIFQRVYRGIHSLSKYCIEKKCVVRTLPVHNCETNSNRRSSATNAPSPRVTDELADGIRRAKLRRKSKTADTTVEKHPESIQSSNSQTEDLVQNGKAGT